MGVRPGKTSASTKPNEEVQDCAPSETTRVDKSAARSNTKLLLSNCVDESMKVQAS